MSREKINIDNFFPSRLKELINKKLGISQTEFAKKIGIKPSYVSMVINEKKGPSADFIAGLYLNYSEYMNWLFKGEGEPDSKDPKTRTIHSALTPEEFAMIEAIRGFPRTDQIDIYLMIMDKANNAMKDKKLPPEKRISYQNIVKEIAKMIAA